MATVILTIICCPSSTVSATSTLYKKFIFIYLCICENKVFMVLSGLRLTGDCVQALVTLQKSPRSLFCVKCNSVYSGRFHCCKALRVTPSTSPRRLYFRHILVKVVQSLLSNRLSRTKTPFKAVIKELQSYTAEADSHIFVLIILSLFLQMLVAVTPMFMF